MFPFFAFFARALHSFGALSWGAEYIYRDSDLNYEPQLGLWGATSGYPEPSPWCALKDMLVFVNKQRQSPKHCWMVENCGHRKD